MIKYNFIKNYNDLNVWSKDSNQLSAPKKINQYSFNEIIIILKKFVAENKLFYIPSLSTLGLAIIFNTIGFIPYLNTIKLESDHQDFEFKIEELNTSNETLESKNKELKNYYQLFVLGSPAYIFSYYLQKHISKDIQITEFLIDKDGFNIYMQAYSVEIINDFIDNMLEWEIIKKDSLIIRNVVKQGNNNQTNSQSKNELFIVEVNGKNNLIGLEDRLKIYKEAYNYGPINKIERYLKLKNISYGDQL